MFRTVALNLSCLSTILFEIQRSGNIQLKHFVSLFSFTGFFGLKNVSFEVTNMLHNLEEGDCFYVKTSCIDFYSVEAIQSFPNPFASFCYKFSTKHRIYSTLNRFESKSYFVLVFSKCFAKTNKYSRLMHALFYCFQNIPANPSYIYLFTTV